MPRDTHSELIEEGLERPWPASRGPLLLGIISVMLGLWLSGMVHDPLEGILLLKRRILATLFITTGVGAAVLWSRLVRAESARSIADRRLRQSTEELHRSANQLPVMMWTMDTRGNRDFVNRAWLDLVGGRIEEHLGDRWVRAVHPEDREGCLREIRDACAAQRPFQTQFRVRSAAGAMRSVIAHGSPRKGPGGEFLGYIGVSLDVTPLLEANQNLQRLLSRELVLRRELDHRVRNNLASLLGLASIYGRAGWSGPEVAAAFCGKVFAIKEVHDLVSASSTQEVELADLIRHIAEANGAAGTQLSAEGPRVFLGPQQAGPMAMILQELFNNSRKHGAISAGGSIRIRWDPEPDPAADGGTTVRLEWDESTAGRPVTPPGDAARGTGIELIKGLAAAELRGDAAFDFAPDSVRCHLTFLKPARAIPEPHSP
jgi:PAS domain S-box-containing protein